MYSYISIFIYLYVYINLYIYIFIYLCICLLRVPTEYQQSTNRVPTKHQQSISSGGTSASLDSGAPGWAGLCAAGRAGRGATAAGTVLLLLGWARIWIMEA